MGGATVNLPASDVPAYVFALLVLVAIGAFLLAVRKATPTLRKIGHAIDDFVGEPARPGVHARPGVVESVALLRGELGDLTRIVDDRTKGLAGDVAALASTTSHRLDEHGSRLDAHGRRLDELGRAFERLSARADPPRPPGT